MREYILSKKQFHTFLRVHMPVVHNYGSRTVRVHLETGVPPIAERRTYDCITGRRAFLWLVFFTKIGISTIYSLWGKLSPPQRPIFLRCGMWDVGGWKWEWKISG
jgi:hypothetical protein